MNNKVIKQELVSKRKSSYQGKLSSQQLASQFNQFIAMEQEKAEKLETDSFKSECSEKEDDSQAKSSLDKQVKILQSKADSNSQKPLAKQGTQNSAESGVPKKITLKDFMRQSQAKKINQTNDGNLNDNEDSEISQEMVTNPKSCESSDSEMGLSHNIEISIKEPTKQSRSKAAPRQDEINMELSIQIKPENEASIGQFNEVAHEDFSDVESQNYIQCLKKDLPQKLQSMCNQSLKHSKKDDLSVSCLSSVKIRQMNLKNGLFKEDSVYDSEDRDGMAFQENDLQMHDEEMIVRNTSKLRKMNTEDPQNLFQHVQQIENCKSISNNHQNSDEKEKKKKSIIFLDSNDSSIDYSEISNSKLTPAMKVNQYIKKAKSPSSAKKSGKRRRASLKSSDNRSAFSSYAKNSHMRKSKFNPNPDQNNSEPGSQSSSEQDSCSSSDQKESVLTDEDQKEDLNQNSQSHNKEVEFKDKEKAESKVMDRIVFSPTKKSPYISSINRKNVISKFMVGEKDRIKEEVLEVEEFNSEDSQM